MNDAFNAKLTIAKLPILAMTISDLAKKANIYSSNNVSLSSGALRPGSLIHNSYYYIIKRDDGLWLAD